MDVYHVFVYCNPSSGGNKAAELLNLPIQKTSFAYEDKEVNIQFQVRIYNLKNKDSREEGFEELKVFKRTSKVKAVAAGGDGTVKWVISELIRVGCIDVAIGVIPFGTGNDMARILGWGSTAPNPLVGGKDMIALKAIIKNLVLGEEVALDVWQVETKVDPDKGRFEVAIKGQVVERPDKKKVVIEQMINYCSFGQDARAVFGFEKHRRTTQFMNKVQYAIEGGKCSLPFQGRNLKGMKLSLDEKEVPNAAALQGIIFQNIPSYAAGSDFWRTRWTPGDEISPQLVGDKLFEVHALQRVIDIGLHKATLGGRGATSRLCHAHDARILFEMTKDVPTYCQIDGEPCRLIYPISCEISPAFQAKMIMRNSSKPVLRASMKATDNILKSGFILKARKYHQKDVWNPRYLALVQRDDGKSLNLEWYLHDVLRGSMCLLKNGAILVKVEKHDHAGPRPNTLFSVKSKQKTLYFSTESEEAREEWLKVLSAS